MVRHQGAPHQRSHSVTQPMIQTKTVPPFFFVLSLINNLWMWILERQINWKTNYYYIFSPFRSVLSCSSRADSHQSAGRIESTWWYEKPLGQPNFVSYRLHPFLLCHISVTGRRPEVSHLWPPTALTPPPHKKTYKPFWPFWKMFPSLVYYSFRMATTTIHFLFHPFLEIWPLYNSFARVPLDFLN